MTAAEKSLQVNRKKSRASLSSRCGQGCALTELQDETVTSGIRVLFSEWLEQTSHPRERGLCAHSPYWGVGSHGKDQALSTWLQCKGFLE